MPRDYNMHTTGCDTPQGSREAQMELIHSSSVGASAVLEPSPEASWVPRTNYDCLFLPWSYGPASRFMAYHKPLKNSQDYTEALRASRALAANITEALRKVPGTDPAFEVFPYT